MDLLRLMVRLISHRIKHESVHAPASSDDQHRRRTVQSIPGSHLVSSGLQSFLQRRSGDAFHLRSTAPDPEDGPDRNEAVDVGRTVERVEHDDVLALAFGFNFDYGLVLLGHKQAGRVRGTQEVDEQFVGEYVEFLDLLALDVRVPGDTKAENGSHHHIELRIP